MVWVVGYAPFGAEMEEVIAVASTEAIGREAAEKHHDEHRDHKVTTALQWDEFGVPWSMARGRRFSGHYAVEEHPVL